MSSFLITFIITFVATLGLVCYGIYIGFNVHSDLHKWWHKKGKARLGEKLVGLFELKDQLDESQYHISQTRR